MGEPAANDGAESGDRATHVVYSKAEDRGEMDPSVAVVDALAEAKDCAPVDLDQALYDVVDPEALDRLFTDTDDGSDADVSSRVVFEFDSHEITVHSNGDVLVRRIDD